MNQIIKLILKAWELLEQIVYESNKRKREKTIEKIKDNPTRAWDDKFSRGNEDG